MNVALRSLALGTALAIGSTALPALAAPVPAAHQDRDNMHQDQDRDNMRQDRDNMRQDRDNMRHDESQYQNNRYYQMGAREGEHDYGRHKRMDHHRKFRSDDDRQAYQSGYEHSWSSRDNNRDEHHDDDNRTR